MTAVVDGGKEVAVEFAPTLRSSKSRSCNDTAKAQMEPHTWRQRVWIVGAVAGLLAALFLQLAFSARDNSITWDEDGSYLCWLHVLEARGFRAQS